MTSHNRTTPQSVFNGPEFLKADREGHALACRDLAKVHPSDLDVGNPNHPINDGLFGYTRSDFMKKQYKG